MHIHHIVPKHTWKRLNGSLEGVNNPKNLIKLSVSDHAAWHYEQWVYFGYKEDWLAWKMLLNEIDKEELWRNIRSINGKRTKGISKQSGFKNKKHSQESKDKMSKKRSANQLGNNNIMFGRCYVNNGLDNKIILKEQLDNYIQMGYYKGRKCGLPTSLI